VGERVVPSESRERRAFPGNVETRYLEGKVKVGKDYSGVASDWVTPAEKSEGCTESWGVCLCWPTGGWEKTKICEKKKVETKTINRGRSKGLGGATPAKMIGSGGVAQHLALWDDGGKNEQSQRVQRVRELQEGRG